MHNILRDGRLIAVRDVSRFRLYVEFPIDGSTEPVRVEIGGNQMPLDRIQTQRFEAALDKLGKAPL